MALKMKIIAIAVVLLLLRVDGLFPGHPTFHRTSDQQQQCQNPKDYTRTAIIDTKDPIILDAVQSVIKTVASMVNLTGQQQTAVSLAIVYNQTVLWSGGFGTMNYLDPLSPAPDGDTVYKIASQTKVFTTMMLLMLRDANLVELEDSVMEVFPDFRLAADPFGTNHDITFKHLATQLSGLPRESPCGTFNTDACNETGPVWDIIGSIVIPIWPPNTLPSYSNLGFSILGRSLAALVGAKYEQWVETNILQPLGMTSSGFIITDDIAKRMPTTKGTDSQPWTKQTDLGWSNPAGQMYSTVNDMSNFIKKNFFRRQQGDTSTVDSRDIESSIHLL
jgi:CubicO group peptidase (beta-lactamase class C family)